MGWSIGYDDNWNRDIGYGVPAVCDKPGCTTKIDRGLAYVCGSDPYGGQNGCGLYFCAEHLDFKDLKNNRTIRLPGEDEITVQLCSKCCNGKPPYEPKPDIAEWIEWKLTDESWSVWREENPEEVKKLSEDLQKEKSD
ncbi:MAG: hypothetical protein JSS81_07325 [Acidobacteria bacterium]|nr:hypothetical protein [Acidobacteriota bacterium]